MKIKLHTLLAKLCYFAQEHVSDPEAWGSELSDREYYFTCVDYQVSCFLAQHTVFGKEEGVECNQVIDALVGEHLSYKEWKKITKELVKEFGGES